MNENWTHARIHVKYYFYNRCLDDAYMDRWYTIAHNKCNNKNTWKVKKKITNTQTTLCTGIRFNVTSFYIYVYFLIGSHNVLILNKQTLLHPMYNNSGAGRCCVDVRTGSKNTHAHIHKPNPPPNPNPKHPIHIHVLHNGRTRHQNPTKSQKQSHIRTRQVLWND